MLLSLILGAFAFFIAFRGAMSGAAGGHGSHSTSEEVLFNLFSTLTICVFLIGLLVLFYAAVRAIIRAAEKHTEYDDPET